MKSDKMNDESLLEKVLGTVGITTIMVLIWLL